MAGPIREMKLNQYICILMEVTNYRLIHKMKERGIKVKEIERLIDRVINREIDR